MRFVGLDGREYAVSLAGHRPPPDESCSSYHLRARSLLALLFPLDLRLEEVSLPGTGGLRADFLLPTRRLAVEAHGRQHYERNPFFHPSLCDFARGLALDDRKAEFCRLNALRLVELPHHESDRQWRARLVGQGPDGEGG